MYGLQGPAALKTVGMADDPMFKVVQPGAQAVLDTVGVSALTKAIGLTTAAPGPFFCMLGAFKLAALPNMMGFFGDGMDRLFTFLFIIVCCCAETFHSVVAKVRRRRLLLLMLLVLLLALVRLVLELELLLVPLLVLALALALALALVLVLALALVLVLVLLVLLTLVLAQVLLALLPLPIAAADAPRFSRGLFTSKRRRNSGWRWASPRCSSSG